MKLVVKRYNTRRSAPAASARPAAPAQEVAPASASAAPGAAMAASPVRPAAAAAAPAPAPAPPAPRPQAASASGTWIGKPDGTLLFDTQEDGFGDLPFPSSAAGQAAAARAAAGSPTPDGAAADDATDETLSSIRDEGLSARQLRLARRLAQRFDLPATSDLDAVRLLREAGIDPFQRGSGLDLAQQDEADEADAPTSPADAVSAGATGTQLQRSGGVRLPQTIKPAKLPAAPTAEAEVNHAAELMRIQRDLVRRRRRKAIFMALRVFFFVILPGCIAGYYYYFIATPLYATKTAFTVQQADPSAGMGVSAGGGRGASAAMLQDPINVQEYLMSRAAMLRLESDVGFREYFDDPHIDLIQRLEPGATDEATYKVYKRNVRIGFDPTEGVIRMEVITPDPAVSVKIAKALIGYAEEQVDQMTQRLREDQMKGARESYVDAEAKRLEAQKRVVELQKKFQILNSAAEVQLIQSQVGSLEAQITKDRLGLAQILSNPNPNMARVTPLKRRIATMEDQVAELRNRLTQSDTPGGETLPDIQAELTIAEADVEVRTKMMAQAIEAMEAARVAANRQVRYLSLSFPPVAPDEATYPRAFENTSVALLIFAGIYLMLSMTAAILREQVSA